MYTCICQFDCLIVFYCFMPSWKIDVLSNEWPLKIKSLLLLVVVVVVEVALVII